MEELAGIEAKSVGRRLEPLVRETAAWLRGQREIDPGSPHRSKTRDQLIDEAERACRRIREGIDLRFTTIRGPSSLTSW